MKARQINATLLIGSGIMFFLWASRTAFNYEILNAGEIIFSALCVILSAGIMCYTLKEELKFRKEVPA